MSDQQVNVVKLPEAFTQPELEAVKAEVDKQLAGSTLLQLDGSLVGSFDSAALQFLVVFENSDFAATPCIVNASRAIVDALRDIGVPSDILKKHFNFVEDGAEKAA